MTDHITIRLPLPPKKLHPNDRAIWQVRAKLTEEYRRTVREACNSEFDGLPPLGWSIVALLPVLYLKTANRHDPDNIVAWLKSCCDGLVDAKIMTGDRRTVWLPPKQFTAESKDEVRLEITVINLEAGRDALLEAVFQFVEFPK